MKITRGIALSLSLATIFLFLTCAGGIAQGQDSVLKEWTNNSGKTVNAKVVGFVAGKNNIKWELQNGESAHSPLSSLSQASRGELMTEPEIFTFVVENFRSYNFQQFSVRQIIILVVTILGILLFCCFIDYQSFKYGIRTLALSNEDLTHL